MHDSQLYIDILFCDVLFYFSIPDILPDKINIFFFMKYAVRLHEVGSPNISNCWFMRSEQTSSQVWRAAVMHASRKPN